MAPINIGTGSATLNVTPSSYDAAADVILLNGTTTDGQTKSLLIDVAGNKAAQAASLAN